MSIAEKRWLFTAAVLVTFGLIFFVGVMVNYDWDFTKLSSVTYVTNTYEESGEFDKISINVDTTEIEFIPTDNEECSIVCFESEKVRHSVTVKNRTLIIDTVDTRKWYDYIGIYLGTPRMTVYLPQNKYTSLLIETDTGDITIPEDFSFEMLNIDGDTSDIDCFASVSGVAEIEVSTGYINIDTITAGQLKLATTTGDIKVKSVDVKNDINFETDTGEIELTDLKCKSIIAESDTGDISLKNVIATDSFSINNDTGDVEFKNSDAEKIYVETSTGDVVGSLLSDKIFITETSTGDINVPETIAGGRCEVSTDTGDIKLSINRTAVG